jgi:hypothetical protein
VNYIGITCLFFCSSVNKCGLVPILTSAGCPQKIQLPKKEPRWRERRDSGDGEGVRRGDARTSQPRMVGRGGVGERPPLLSAQLRRAAALEPPPQACPVRAVHGRSPPLPRLDHAQKRKEFSCVNSTSLGPRTGVRTELGQAPDLG